MYSPLLDIENNVDIEIQMPSFLQIQAHNW